MKAGGEGRNRTDECSFCRAVPYHLATPPSKRLQDSGVRLGCKHFAESWFALLFSGGGGGHWQDHGGEGGNVGLEGDENADERGQDDAVDENIAEDLAFLAVVIRRGAGDDDALGIDHLAHDAAGTVRGAHEDGADTGLFGGDFLQAAEEDVGGGVGSGEGNAEPAEQCSKKWIEAAGLGEGQTEGGVSARVFGDVTEGEHGGDGY